MIQQMYKRFKMYTFAILTTGHFFSKVKKKLKTMLPKEGLKTQGKEPHLVLRILLCFCPIPALPPTGLSRRHWNGQASEPQKGSLLNCATLKLTVINSQVVSP